MMLRFIDSTVSSLTRPLPKNSKERGTLSLVWASFRPAVYSRRDKLRGTRLRQGNTPAPANVEDIALVKRQLTAIVSRIETEADGQKIQNGALAWASCIGTIAWGFGDVLAAWLNRIVH